MLANIPEGMMKYRTLVQFEEICNNMLNGNWSDASQCCIDYGFFANDLQNAQDETEFPIISNVWDFVTVVEMAQQLRGE